MSYTVLSLLLASAILLVMLVRCHARLEGARDAEALGMTDPLTGVKNRRYILQTIEKDIASTLRRLPRMRRPQPASCDADLTFFVIDLDGLKGVNDARGHAAGDIALTAAAQALLRTCRESDVVARWGGDEFVVLTRFVDRADAAVTAERLRAAIASQWIALPGTEAYRITCSVGFASYPFDLRDPEARVWTGVFGLADLAMYAAKRAGRDRCVGLVAGLEQLPPSEVIADSADVDRLLGEGRLQRVDVEEPDGAAPALVRHDELRRAAYSYSSPSRSAASSTRNVASSSATASM